MRILGLALVLGGWAIAVAGLLLTPSIPLRTVIALVGISVSLCGSLGALNSYYLARAIWKK